MPFLCFIFDTKFRRKPRDSRLYAAERGLKDSKGSFISFDNRQWLLLPSFCLFVCPSSTKPSVRGPLHFLKGYAAMFYSSCVVLAVGLDSGKPPLNAVFRRILCSLKAWVPVDSSGFPILRLDDQRAKTAKMPPFSARVQRLSFKNLHGMWLP